MELKFRLLEHPFYQAWANGKVTMTQLAKYHLSYQELVDAMPNYWNSILSELRVNEVGQFVVQEETYHCELWRLWSKRLPKVESYPNMTNTLQALDLMTPSGLLGAIHAFEIQQPEVALTKKEGLINHYGFTDDETLYFDEHMKEEAHLQVADFLKEKYANESEFNRGFEDGSVIFYKGLDHFLN